jgi:hypothetical protein
LFTCNIKSDFSTDLIKNFLIFRKGVINDQLTPVGTNIICDVVEKEDQTPDGIKYRGTFACIGERPDKAVIDTVSKLYLNRRL